MTQTMYISICRRICFMLLVAFVYAQDITAQSDSVFQYEKTIAGKFSYFNVDNLDNVYLINETNQLKKITAKGDSAGVFNDVKKFGNPSYIDVTNPLKLLLYYKNYSTVITLDRFLAVRNNINLRRQNIFFVNNITLSYDNYIWLFDEEDYRLKKIDEDGKLLQSTVDWRMLFDSVPAPVKIIDRDNYVYLYDPEKGFYIFDYYGAFKNRLAFLHWKNVEVTGNTMFGFSDNTLYSYELKSLQLKAFPLPEFFGKYKSIKAMNGKIYLLKDTGIDVYRIK